MAFMNSQVTEKQDWILCETSNGTQCVRGDLVDVAKLRRLLAKDTTQSKAEAYAVLKEYLECFSADQFYSFEIQRAYGVRLSAAGYMDCTDWETFTNKREAIRRARELDRESEGE